MIGRIVEIASTGCYLSLDRGFLVISCHGEEVGRTPIDDIAGLIGNGFGLAYSNNVLVALAERCIPFVLCGANHRPAAILWPIEGHHRQAARMDAQIRASLPHKKRLWKQIVQAKIGMQAAALSLYGCPEAPLRRMVGKVRAGDPSNVEGQAARTYWPLLLGAEFRRDRSAEGANALLNYGYTVLRATVARHLMAAGLHPGVALHHANEANAMRLVDDVMEPFRPMVDVWVRRLLDSGSAAVNTETKRVLALLPTRSLLTSYGVSPVSIVIQRLCISLAQTYENPALRLDFPHCVSATLAPLLDETVTHKREEEAAI